MPKIRISFIFLLIVLLPNRMLAQTDKSNQITYESRLSDQNIFIQTDKETYQNGEIIWFKSYILERSNLKPSLRTKTLYVTLENEESKHLVFKERFTITDGFSNGQIYIEDTLKAGLYRLAAFTSNSINAGAAPIASYKTIDVQGDLPRVNLDAVFEKQRYKPKETVGVKLNFYDPKGQNLANERVKISYISSSAKDESQVIRTNDKGEVRLSIPAKFNSSETKIQMHFDKKGYRKFSRQLNIPRLDTASLKFDLFPEGGHLVHGLESKMAFKATDEFGIPIEVQGVLTEDGKTIAALNSLHDGMGFIKFIPDESRTYKVHLKQPIEVTYSIPPIQASGISATMIKNNNDILQLKVSRSSQLKDARVSLQIRANGELKWKGESLLEETQNLITIPVRTLPNGILELSIQSEDSRVHIERLVFKGTHGGLNIKNMTAIEAGYGNKQKVMLKFNILDRFDEPSSAHLALRVYDNANYKPALSTSIDTHYHLFSNLNGKIHNPSQYFEPDNEFRLQHLDLLLLTHGWRNYVYQEQPLDKSNYLNEINLEDDYFLQARSVDRKGTLKELDTPLLAKLVYSFGILDVWIPKDGKLEVPLYENEVTLVKIPKDAPVIIKDPKHFELISTLISKKGYKDNRQDFFPSGKKRKRLDLAYYYASNNIFLDEVVVNATKKLRKTIGLEQRRWVYPGNGDYVCSEFNVLNCVNHSFGGYEPIEGEEYKLNNGTSVVYYKKRQDKPQTANKKGFRYIKGYHLKKEFFSPTYSDAPDEFPDERSTLAWAPNLISDENGELGYSFFTSDINSSFTIHMEGVDANGNIGSWKKIIKVRPDERQ